MLKRQWEWECLPVILICPRRPRLHIRHMSGQGKRRSVRLTHVLFSVQYSQQITWGTFSELDKNWLVDPAYATNQAGLKIQGSRGDSEGFDIWDNGMHEGKEGKLKSVFDTGSDHILRTANLLIDDLELTVPIIYLVPTPPRQVRDKVVALDGRYKGQIASVRDMMHDSCLVTIDDSIYDGSQRH